MNSLGSIFSISDTELYLSFLLGCAISLVTLGVVGAGSRYGADPGKAEWSKPVLTGKNLLDIPSCQDLLLRYDIRSNAGSARL